MATRAWWLWFDVGIKRYTTWHADDLYEAMLWFDVGIKRYTTHVTRITHTLQLWFDVGIKRYTTSKRNWKALTSCGLM